jgi:hypothetical protein
MRKGALAVPVLALAGAAAIAGCGGDDDGGGIESPALAAEITEAELPPGYEAAPEVTLQGERWRFDKIPGHYWRVLDNGYAVGLHFQSDEPFKWARDVPKGELLYLVYAIPGNCGNGSFAKAVQSPTATAVGATPPGFDHWHAVPGGKSRVGHWLMHVPVRDFTLAGPPGNPMSGTEVVAGKPGFMPVCDIR